jgi:RNA processing factor Prp31
MMAMAQNLTVLVGKTVGARLIAHAGSLVNLAKHPASTVQILGNYEKESITYYLARNVLKCIGQCVFM